MATPAPPDNSVLHQKLDGDLKQFAGKPELAQHIVQDIVADLKGVDPAQRAAQAVLDTQTLHSLGLETIDIVGLSDQDHLIATVYDKDRKNSKTEDMTTGQEVAPPTQPGGEPPHPPGEAPPAQGEAKPVELAPGHTAMLKPDGSGTYTIQPGDNPWKLAERILEQRNGGKRPSAKEINDFERGELAQANGGFDKLVKLFYPHGYKDGKPVYGDVQIPADPSKATPAPEAAAPPPPADAPQTPADAPQTPPAAAETAPAVKPGDLNPDANGGVSPIAVPGLDQDPAKAAGVSVTDTKPTDQNGSERKFQKDPEVEEPPEYQGDMRTDAQGHLVSGNVAYKDPRNITIQANGQDVTVEGVQSVQVEFREGHYVTTFKGANGVELGTFITDRDGKNTQRAPQT